MAVPEGPELRCGGSSVESVHPPVTRRVPAVDEASKLASRHMAPSGIHLADISEVRLEARPLCEVACEVIALAGIEDMDDREDPTLDPRRLTLRREANR